jgi:hypothetical protein
MFIFRLVSKIDMKIGRPKGTDVYKAADFYQYVAAQPRNTLEITRLAKVRFPKVHNVTVKKFLGELKDDGRVRGTRVGSIDIWYK